MVKKYKYVGNDVDVIKALETAGSKDYIVTGDWTWGTGVITVEGIVSRKRPSWRDWLELGEHEPTLIHFEGPEPADGDRPKKHLTTHLGEAKLQSLAAQIAAHLVSPVKVGYSLPSDYTELVATVAVDIAKKIVNKTSQ